MTPLFSARGVFSDDQNHGLRTTTVPQKSYACAAAVNGAEQPCLFNSGQAALALLT